ncbi:MAG: hypothetical protein AMXMBFR34_17820 [Myxococcaceae bacterium]
MRRRVHVLLLLGFAAACGPDVVEPGAIALERDFADYRAWPSFVLEPVPNDGGLDPVHTADPRVVYINRLPDAGVPEFPVGTLIVKESPFNVFAMGKRGGEYNASGATGWEWFELFRDGASGRVTIEWRGLGPPAGESYGKAGQTCNACHGAFAANDSVISAPLQVIGR